MEYINLNHVVRASVSSDEKINSKGSARVIFEMVAGSNRTKPFDSVKEAEIWLGSLIIKNKAKVPFYKV
jgi:hypothetical protein